MRTECSNVCGSQDLQTHFFFKQKTAYEIGVRLVGSEMCIRDRVLVRGDLPLGQFAEVKITGHTDYDLIAEPA